MHDALELDLVRGGVMEHALSVVRSPSYKCCTMVLEPTKEAAMPTPPPPTDPRPKIRKLVVFTGR
jgi:hypothetical protein